MEIISKYTTVLMHKTDEYKVAINRKCLWEANINMEKQSSETFGDQINVQIKRNQILQDVQFHMKWNEKTRSRSLYCRKL